MSRDGQTAQPACVPRLHNEPSSHTLHNEQSAQRAFRKPDSLHSYQKGLAIALPRVPNGLGISCRERAAQDGLKMQAILRAKRSAACPCSAAAVGGVSRQTTIYISHTLPSIGAVNLCSAV